MDSTPQQGATLRLVTFPQDRDTPGDQHDCTGYTCEHCQDERDKLVARGVRPRVKQPWDTAA